MRIVVDVSPLSIPPTGIGNYIIGMVRGLAEAGGERHEVVAFAPAGPRSRERIAAALDGFPVERRLPLVFPYAHAWRTAWSHLGRPVVERLVGRLDVFHFSDWMYPPQRAGLRTTMFHDLIPLRFPEWVHPRTLRIHSRKARHAARTCDLVVANSEFTANEIAELLRFPRERILVAYPGVDERFRPEGPRHDGDPYVLMLAAGEPRKNYANLAAAVELVREQRPELRFLAPDYVDHAELPALFRGAAVFAYPSFFEGFGISVLEAMACGTPVVASSHASLDEACGDAAVRADPESPEAIAAGIERALAERESLVPRGLEHARRFTWRACGEAHLHGFETAL
jgi:glycosyltransferase involved in cell wall biosynthesis